ncbi:hypothetical protein [Acidovorax sp. sic0104]|uniref:hypothetical protein n=1 Tax=Acidovorax sp. sic0104 TaxID=2854784 RepID=UPI001C447586|nr:hypothetical protein [Acidovorax sp. sic0104]MBV7543713.1 hypothetical protein [Acidovorax sp. sic0104]
MHTPSDALHTVVSIRRTRVAVRKATALGLATAALLLAACKDRAPEAPAVGAAPAAAPAVATPPAASTTSAVAAAPPAAPVAAASPKRVPLAVQGVAAAGVTVRIKAVEIGADATVLDVSISFANRITNTTMLALADTYLQDETGARLHIKRPDNNRDITIREGETLDGQLVFMGAVSPSARKLKLVFNDGNQDDNIVAPGLVVDLPLQGG